MNEIRKLDAKSRKQGSLSEKELERLSDTLEQELEEYEQYHLRHLAFAETFADLMHEADHGDPLWHGIEPPSQDAYTRASLRARYKTLAQHRRLLDNKDPRAADAWKAAMKAARLWRKRYGPKGGRPPKPQVERILARLERCEARFKRSRDAIAAATKRAPKSKRSGREVEARERAEDLMSALREPQDKGSETKILARFEALLLSRRRPRPVAREMLATLRGVSYKTIARQEKKAREQGRLGS